VLLKVPKKVLLKELTIGDVANCPVRRIERMLLGFVVPQVLHLFSPSLQSK
jgi:hypothetical protein